MLNFLDTLKKFHNSKIQNYKIQKSKNYCKTRKLRRSQTPKLQNSKTLRPELRTVNSSEQQRTEANSSEL